MAGVSAIDATRVASENFSASYFDLAAFFPGLLANSTLRPSLIINAFIFLLIAHMILLLASSWFRFRKERKKEYLERLDALWRNNGYTHLPDEPVGSLDASQLNASFDWESNPIVIAGVLFFHDTDISKEDIVRCTDERILKDIRFRKFRQRVAGMQHFDNRKPGQSKSSPISGRAHRGGQDEEPIEPCGRGNLDLIEYFDDHQPALTTKLR